MSLNPVRHSQCLIGAGFGSANSNRVRSSTDCQRGIALTRRQQALDFREGSRFDMRGCQNAADRAVAQRFKILSILAAENGEILPAPAQQIE